MARGVGAEVTGVSIHGRHRCPCGAQRIVYSATPAARYPLLSVAHWTAPGWTDYLADAPCTEPGGHADWRYEGRPAGRST